MCKKLVTLNKYESYAEADFDRLKLSLQGIDAWVADHASYNLVPDTASPAEHVRLLVPESQMFRAAQQLNILQQPGQLSEGPFCLLCFSENVSVYQPRLKLSEWVFLVYNRLLARTAPMPRYYCCKSCGCQFPAQNIYE